MNSTTEKRPHPYRNFLEVEKLVREFESCTLSLDNFNHPAHLAVALVYLSRMTASDATSRMRESLHRILAHYGLTGYNETITLFWFKLVQRFLTREIQERALIELLNELVERYGDARLIFDYYTREKLMSEEAKAAWVEPDLKPLDF